MKMSVAERAIVERNQLLNKAVINKAIQQVLFVPKSSPTVVSICDDLTVINSKNCINTQYSINQHAIDTSKIIDMVCIKKDLQFSNTYKDRTEPSYYAESTGWKDENFSLINWFMSLTLEQMPKTPFQLTPWSTINGPLFFVRLREAIVVGPNGPRARYGALQDDLKKLKKMIELKK